MKNLLRGTRFIAFFLMLSVYPGALTVGLERQHVWIIGLELFIYTALIFSAIGIFFRRPWGRALAVRVLFLNFFYILYVIIVLIGPFFSAIVQYLEQDLPLSREMIRGGLIAVVVVSILWPMAFIYFLSHPKVKRLFSSSDPLKEDQEDGVSGR